MGEELDAKVAEILSFKPHEVELVCGPHPYAMVYCQDNIRLRVELKDALVEDEQVQHCEKVLEQHGITVTLALEMF